MRVLQYNPNPAVELVLKKYPKEVQHKLHNLRNLIIEVANETNEIIGLEETLRWGEPSFITKHGSTIRIDWKPKTPNQYALYFKCTSKLVPAFKEAYGTLFSFEGTRAILFQLNDQLPEQELKQCIKAGLMYHKVKQLPLLGL